ncbi:hypothetical protein [Cytobacillus firmus]|uniref:hypothetical protein n=1 Tax=Cytobacillus firmus TaxID=1399 RepID=UPI003211D2E9
MIHTLTIKDENLHGSFSNEYKPALTIHSGDSIRLQTPDIQWGYSSSKDMKEPLLIPKRMRRSQVIQWWAPLRFMEQSQGWF